MALAANDAELALDTLFTVILNVLASPLVNVISALDIDAVIKNEPESTEGTFSANDAV